MKVSNGMTWDMVAYLSGLNEFAMDTIIKDNSYAYCDVITFDGGEDITVNAEPLVVQSTIKAPWE